MKLFYIMATVALLTGSAARAESSDSFAASIVQSYTDAGYTNVVVTKIDGDWYVTGDFGGVTQSFLVDKHTGASVAVAAVPAHEGRGHSGRSADGVSGAVNDDVNDDVGDDHGGVSGDDSSDDDSADDDVSGDDSSGHDSSGGDSSGDDDGDDDHSGSGNDD